MAKQIYNHYFGWLAPFEMSASVPLTQWRSQYGSKGHSAPLTAKYLPKIRKKRENHENLGQREKLGRKDKNWDGSFTLPLLIDRADYATALTVKEGEHCPFGTH